MRKLAIALVLTLVAVACVAGQVCAQVATSDEALTVARNWVDLIIAKKGAWGDSPTATVTSVQEYRRGPESPVLGYFCPVSPKGWIVISLYKDLASVKAYSDEDDLDPSENDGLGDLIKGSVEGMITGVEKQLGKKISQATSKEIQGTLGLNLRAGWRLLGGDSEAGETGITRSILGANYTGGQVLTTTHWHQDSPYNLQCPAGSGCTHTIVGCVATAGAQVLRYWCWPPEGSGSPYDDSYDWKNMPNRAYTSSPQEVQDAVAELSREVGQAVGMSYGCDASSANTSDMEGVYQNQYRYADCDVMQRQWYDPFWPFTKSHSPEAWYGFITEQLNQNRPLHYRIKSHSIVCDGWQIVDTTKQYHINYGWGGSRTAWYTLDAITQADSSGTIYDEYIIRNIRPNCALGATIAGDYTVQGYPYRYFDRDADCSAYAWFVQGQGLQFLPNIVFRATTTTNYAFIDGQPAATTRLFTRGDQTRGVRIDSGTIRMHGGGSLVLR